MRRIVHWSLLAVVAIAVSAAAYHIVSRETGKTVAGQSAIAASKGEGRIAVVDAARVSTGTVVDTIRAVGSLRANEAVVVAPEIAGRIARLPFSEGDRVKAGDTLVELDSDILRAELDKAQSALTLASANRKRATTLARRGTGTLRARDEAVAAFLAAQANVALARARLEKATITAPLSGVVGLRSVSVGAYVRPGDHIVELASIDPIKVDFRVPGLVLSHLRAGQAIRVTVDAFPGRTFDGEIYVIDPIVDANGRAVRLRARIPNAQGLLTPGLFARVRIVLDRRENAVLVPESAVFSDGDARYVYRVVDGHAVRTKVALGQRRPGEVEVRSGLGHDAVVVVAGQQKIHDGSRVSVAGPGTGA